MRVRELTYKRNGEGVKEAIKNVFISDIVQKGGVGSSTGIQKFLGRFVWLLSI